MRGTPNGRRSASTCAGIIPAYAGNTGGHWSSLIKGRDHPRVCGEHTHTRTYAHSIQGSSPRMRGTLLPCPRLRSLRGIIPAYAGNTCTVGESTECQRDHPRVCGEHYRFVYCPKMPSGSSPRMRGTLASLGNLRNVKGIIPAYAGNTCAM